MRILITLATCIALTSSVATAWGGPAAQTERRTTLRLLDRDPVKLRGTRFQPGEQIRVTSTLGVKRKVRTTRADGAGVFAMTFADQSADRCMTFLATAVGNRGSVAFMKLPGALCPPRL